MAHVEPPASGNGGPAYRGHRVVDDHHRTVGRVTDVLYGDDGAPRWIVVSAGMFRSEHVLPLKDTYISLDGDVVVPYDKRVVARAPKVSRDHVLTDDVERDLEHYYRLVA